MTHLYLFNSHKEFEAAQPYLALPYVVFDGEHVHYSVDPPIIKVPLGADGVENGYGWVDLKLPSGTKWAQCNIGATIPCEPGLLFQWGRVDGYEHGDINHQFSVDDPPTPVSGKSYTTGDILSPEDDAATVNMGGKWRMPTKADMDELYKNTTSSWVTCYVEHEGEHTAMLGRVFVSKIDESKMLFLPASGRWAPNSFRDRNKQGRFWSSECTNPTYAYNFYVQGNTRPVGNTQRNCAMSVRAVVKNID